MITFLMSKTKVKTNLLHKKQKCVHVLHSSDWMEFWHRGSFVYQNKCIIKKSDGNDNLGQTVP